jgi:heme exporter protein C
VHFSVVWWRTLHQPPTLLSPDPAPMDPRMLLALMVSLVAFTLAGAVVFRRRVRMLARTDAEAELPVAGRVAGAVVAERTAAPPEPLVVVPRSRP